jgi:Protein of unknown function (DUF4038)/Putative collagen-binding domain of a collagenase
VRKLLLCRDAADAQICYIRFARSKARGSSTVDESGLVWYARLIEHQRRCRVQVDAIVAIMLVVQSLLSSPRTYAAPDPAQIATAQAVQRFGISANGRYLTRDGAPFLWLGDTGSRIVHRLNRADIDFYLTNRAHQGFTTILVAAVRAHADEWSLTNQYGDRPFVDSDLTRPATTGGSNPAIAEEYDWWDHLDYIVDDAAAKGLVIGLVPFAVGADGNGFNYMNTFNAEVYGQFIGDRYKDKPNVIWVLGWDNDPETPNEQAVWNLLARGITKGVAGGAEDYSKTMMTFHTIGTSSKWFHNSPWLDFNMIQTHVEYGQINPLITTDYKLIPTKPTGIGEGYYELFADDNGVTPDADVQRNQAYSAFLSGGYYTYGNWGVWFFDPSVAPNWKDLLNMPSIQQLGYLRDLLVSKPWWTYSPRQEIFATGISSGTTLSVAARAASGTSVIAYLPQPTTVMLRMDQVAGRTVAIELMNPATNARIPIGAFPNIGTQAFSTPAGWQDMVILLDAIASRN